MRLVTNETQCTRGKIAQKLQGHGFTIKEDEIFPPAMAMAKLAKELGLRPHLLVHPNVVTEFAGVQLNSDDPNCVVLGDATSQFTYENMNKAFKRMVSGGASCQLFSLGKGKYYQEDGELTLDVGPFTAALEYATGQTATIVGKPSRDFFMTALKDMGEEIPPDHAIMVGDDVISDVGGAQACGLQGVLVRTGKFRPSDESHPQVNPDKIVDNLKHFVDILLA